MIKFGYISQVSNDGRARVFLPEDNMTTHSLPICYPLVSDIQAKYTPKVNDHVACLMDQRNERGVIIGSIYDDSNTPSGVSTDTYLLESASGNIKMSSASFYLSIENQGIDLSNGGDDLKTILVDFITALESETHLSPAGGSTGPPDPATLTALGLIKTRLQNLLK